MLEVELLQPKKKWCTTWESWLRCQMSTGLENNLINTRGIGHAVCIAVTCLLWSFGVYLQQIGKLLSIWTDNQPTKVPTLRSDATCRRTSECSIILLLLLQEIASTCFKQKENYSSSQPRALDPKYQNLEVWIQILPVLLGYVILHCKRNKLGNYNINYLPNFSFQVFKPHCWIKKAAVFLRTIFVIPQ